jgi:predicted HD superfamily hydrolase involved in NAD metabolism
MTNQQESRIMLRERVIAWLKDNVSPRRLKHILGVEQTCIELATCHRVDPEQAAQAGLMHDLAKFFPPEKLLYMARSTGLEIDPICENRPHLLHADVSAIVARQEFAVTNPEILDAIANHTLGSPQMSLLSCVVYVADTIEPSRGNSSDLKVIRKAAVKNLYQGVRQASDYSIRYLISNEKIIHPRTIATRNWALNLAKEH